MILTFEFDVQRTVHRNVFLQGCWKVLSPTYFPMYFVWWWEYFLWC